MKRIASGTKVGRLLRSGLINYLIEGSDLAHHQKTGPPEPDRQQPRAGEVTIVNETDGDLAAFEVVSLRNILFTPVDALREFLFRFAFRAALPGEGDGSGRIAVTLAPIASGKPGPALATGLTPLKIVIPDEEEYTAAKIIDGQTVLTADNAGGDIIIVWHEPGPGTVWAIAHLGAASGGSACAGLHELSVEGNPVAGTFTWRYQVESVNGNIELDFDADAAAAQAAFEMHSALDSNLVEVTGGPLPHVALYVEFSDEIELTATPLLVANALTQGIDDPFDPQPKLRLR